MNVKQADDLLFDYLENILFSPEKASLDPSDLPEEFQRWVEAFSYLANCILENKTFVTALSKGNLSIQPPPVDNPIAAPAKALQGSLRHIVWQTNQVAKGDYKQHLDFMGEFTDGFNTMVSQLAERTKKLEQAKASAEEKNIELSQTRDLFSVLVHSTPEFMVVLDLEDNTEYVLNRSAEAFRHAEPDAADALRHELWLHAQSYHTEYSKWDMTLSMPDSHAPDHQRRLHYNVDSYPLLWKGRKAMAHIMRDRTVETEKEQLLMREAFNDPLTGLYNRRYAMEHLEQLYNNEVPFCISMVDVDHLKYCNDVLGHECGDAYLLHISRTLSTMKADVLTCRIGGDEFLVIAQSGSMDDLNAALETLRANLMQDKLFPPFLFVPSFSYGTSTNMPIGGKSLSELLKEADVLMYQYKLQNKPQLKDYKDCRI